MNKKMLTLVLLVAGAFLPVGWLAYAQEREPGVARGQAATDPNSSNNLRYFQGDVITGSNVTYRRSPNTFVAKRQEAGRKIADAKTEEDRKVARDELRSILSEAFDADMTQRKAELADLEARIERLRAQYEKRLSAKQDVVELELKHQELSAKGIEVFGNSPLGSDWGRPAQSSFNPFGSTNAAGQRSPATGSTGAGPSSNTRSSGGQDVAPNSTRAEGLFRSGGGGQNSPTSADAPRRP